jgi:glucose-1-phosphate cytidylyltransferase
LKVAILAGGLGSRLAEETVIRPKPLVEIGGRPILWHIMKHYAHYGHDDFVIAAGYKGEMIKRWWVDYGHLVGDLTIRPAHREVTVRGPRTEDWTVSVVETGQTANTGARVRRLKDWLGEGTFMLTYGDGVSDIDLGKLLDFHRSHGRLATLTAVRPIARFGHLELDGDRITEFNEKPQVTEGWINGAFYVLEPEVIDYIDDQDDTAWERTPLESLAKDGQLMAYRHGGFWQCMDSLREKHLLEELWLSGHAPWKTWE